MFNKLKEFFQGEQTDVDVDRSGAPTEHDLHLATAVILIEMAGADEEIDRAEAQTICATIQNQFGIPENEVPELIEVALAAKREAGKIDEFVKVINSNFNPTQRQRILMMVWKVVMADGKIDKFEQRFAEQMRNRFQLTVEQAEEAKQMAQS